MTTPSLNDQVLALTQQGVSLEEAARKILDSESPARKSTALTETTLADEVVLAMYHGDESTLELADDTPMLPAFLIDKPCHLRVHALARKRHQTVHKTVRDLVRKGLTHTIKEGV